MIIDIDFPKVEIGTFPPLLLEKVAILKSQGIDALEKEILDFFEHWTGADVTYIFRDTELSLMLEALKELKTKKEDEWTIKLYKARAKMLKKDPDEIKVVEWRETDDEICKMYKNMIGFDPRNARILCDYISRLKPDTKKKWWKIW